jgi:hypothetical protein
VTEPDSILNEIRQRRHLEELVARAERIHAVLGHLLAEHGNRVHFRPSATGVDMVGLTPERPFALRPAIKNVGRFVERFEEEFQRHCVDVPAGRVGAEQKLQAYLMRTAYPNRRRMLPLEHAAAESGAPVQLEFVTDDIVVPYMGRRFACDLLAVETAPEGAHAVVLEVGRKRGDPLNVQRVIDYARIVSHQSPVFSRLFSALLGRPITLVEPCQRWILWPTATEPDTLEGELRANGIRLAEYEAAGDEFRLRAAGWT